MSDLQNGIRKAYEDLMNGFISINKKIDETIEESRRDTILIQSLADIQARLAKLSRSMASLTL